MAIINFLNVTPVDVKHVFLVKRSFCHQDLLRNNVLIAGGKRKTQMRLTQGITYTSDSLKHLAYKKWTSFSQTRCSCANHFKENQFVCEKERLWRVYVKIRDGFHISEKEKELLSLN